MSESSPWLVRVWDDLGVPATLAGGGLLFESLRRWRKRVKARKEREHELLEAVAAWAQVSIEEAGWRDWLTSTNRVHPLSDAEAAEQRGAYRQRRKEAADRLRAVLRNERRLEPRRQDVLAPKDLEGDEP